MLHGDLTANNILLQTEGGPPADLALAFGDDAAPTPPSGVPGPAADGGPAPSDSPAEPRPATSRTPSGASRSSGASPPADFVAKVSDLGLSRDKATDTAVSTNTFGTVR